MKKIISFLAFLSFYTCFSQSISWSPKGIGGGGALFAPSINPANDNEYYAGCDMSELFHTTDFGLHYSQLNFKQTQGGHNSTVRFTNNPNTLYTIDYTSGAPGYSPLPYKSTDGGLTWFELPGNPDNTQEVYFIDADYNNPNNVIIGFYGEIYFSNDGGTTFNLIHSAANSGAGVVVGGTFFDGSTIYIGTNDGLLVSTNSGSSFSISSTTGLGANEQIFSFAGAKVGSITRFFCVTADANDVFAGVVGSDYYQFIKGVYAMDYGTGTWAPRMNGIDINNDFLMFAGMAWNDINTVYLAGSNSNGEPEIMKSTNAGTSWSHVFNSSGNQNIATGWCGQSGDRGWGYAECAFGMAVAPNNSAKVIFTDFGFIHTSSDGGTSWQQAYVDAADQHTVNANTPVNQSYHSVGLENTTCWQVHWTNASGMFACFSDIRGIKSSDGGDSWSYNYTGHTSNSMYRIAEHPANGTLYAAVSGVHDMYQSTRISDNPLDNTDNSGKLIYSTNGGSTWQLLHNFGNHPVFWIALDPNNPNRAYASVIHYNGGSGAGGIYRCDDLQNLASSAWTLLPDPPRTEKHPASITVLNDGKMICSYSARKVGSSTFDNCSGVFMYDPVGNSWTDVSDPGMHYWTKDVVVDPNDPLQNTWYAGVFSGWGGVANGLGGLYKTTNRGLSWTRISTIDRVTSITFNPSNANEIYMTTETDGLWKSSNINAATPSFSLVNNYPFRQPERVFFNPANAGEIWVTSFGNGLWKGTIASTGIEEITAGNDLKIYPNPSSAFITVEANSPSGIVIYNSTGEIVFNTSVTTKTEINISNFASGLYLVKAGNRISRLIKN